MTSTSPLPPSFPDELLVRVTAPLALAHLVRLVLVVCVWGGHLLLSLSRLSAPFLTSTLHARQG